MTLMIQDATTIAELEAVWEQVGEEATEGQLDIYLQKKAELTPKEVKPEDIKLESVTPKKK
jgi:hypothetical protein